MTKLFILFINEQWCIRTVGINEGKIRVDIWTAGEIHVNSGGGGGMITW